MSDAEQSNVEFRAKRSNSSKQKNHDLVPTEAAPTAPIVSTALSHALSHQLAVLETRNARLEKQLLSQHMVAQIIAQSTSLDAAIPQILEAICEYTGWDFGEIWHVDTNQNLLVSVTTWQGEVPRFPEFGDVSRRITFAPSIGLPGRVWVNQQALWIPDVVEDKNFPRAPFAARDGLHGGVGLPIRVHGNVIGVMCFFSRMARPPEKELLQVLDYFGQQVGLFTERKRAERLEHEQLQQQSAAEERLRVAHELHQTGLQTAFAAALAAELLPYLWDRDLNKIWYGLEELRQLTRTSLKQSHSLLSRLGAENLATVDAGELLDMVIKKLTAESHLKVELTVQGECALPTDIQMGLYCIVQEAVQNIMQHARATRATVSLHAYLDAAELRINDNGRGFDLNTILPDRLGLRIMRESAERFGADLEIASKINQGTQITLRWNNIPARTRPLFRSSK